MELKPHSQYSQCNKNGRKSPDNKNKNNNECE